MYFCLYFLVPYNHFFICCCIFMFVLIYFFFYSICFFFLFFFFKQKPVYEVRISDCSSDVCSSDLFIGCGILSRSAGDILTRSDVASLTANQSCYLLFERLLARRGRRPFEEVANLCNCSCRVLIDSRRCCNISARDFSSSLSRARSDASQSRCKII